MSFAHKISKYNRNRKWVKFHEEINPLSTDKILDVGFSDHEYSPVDNYLEKNYPFPEMITALGIDKPDEFRIHYPKVKVIQYSGNKFPFEDNEFDICWSNAVIEHVGNKEKQITFIKEIKRVSRIAFITTPNKYFPIELHTRTPFLHLLPKNMFDQYLRRIGKSWATGDYMNLLTKNDLCNLFSLADIHQYRIIPNRFFGFAMDFVMIF
jgi:SAM-dependent methyltransferase